MKTQKTIIGTITASFPKVVTETVYSDWTGNQFLNAVTARDSRWTRGSWDGISDEPTLAEAIKWHSQRVTTGGIYFSPSVEGEN
jgi:hypothetical protein